MNKTVLFDMDGTLTEAREEITDDVLEALYELHEEAEIGILTGSDLNYIKEQISTFSYEVGSWGMMFNQQSDDPIIKHILPCNGTKYYTYHGLDLDFDLKSSVSMERQLGQEKFNMMIEKLLQLQIDVVKLFPSIPLTGKFIDYRDSMINWCPIGRNAGEAQRNQFVNLDKDFKLRGHFVEDIRKWLTANKMDVTVALGGQTSFDIYPNGWDKSYALKHFKNHEVYFVGDKCEKDGNDFAIYNLLDVNKRFKVSSPEDTIEVIYDELIPRLKSEN